MGTGSRSWLPEMLRPLWNMVGAKWGPLERLTQEMLKPLWNMVGAKWGPLERLTSGDREAPAPRLKHSCGSGPGKWRGAAEMPRDSRSASQQTLSCMYKLRPTRSRSSPGGGGCLVFRKPWLWPLVSCQAS